MTREFCYLAVELSGTRVTCFVTGHYGHGGEFKLDQLHILTHRHIHTQIYFPFGTIVELYAVCPFSSITFYANIRDTFANPRENRKKQKKKEK